MDLSESWALLTARQHPEAIRRALDEHGIPDHLWGLLDWLYGVAHDVPPHSRPDGYTEIMAIVDQSFDHDPQQHDQPPRKDPMTTTVESRILSVLTAHAPRGRVDGPGYRALRCSCGAEIDPAEFAAHQTAQVMAAIRTDLEPGQDGSRR